MWFGEGIDPNVIRTGDAAAECDVFLSIGTSAVVYPVATDASGTVNIAIAAPAEIALPHIDSLRKA